MLGAAGDIRGGVADTCPTPVLKFNSLQQRSGFRHRGRRDLICDQTGAVLARLGLAPIVLSGVPARRSLTCVSRKPRTIDFSAEKSRFRVSREPDPMGGFNRWSVRAVCFAGAQMFFASTQIHDRLQEEWRHPQFGYTRCTPDFGPFLCFSSSYEARLFNRLHMFAVARIRGCICFLQYS